MRAVSVGNAKRETFIPAAARELWSAHKDAGRECEVEGGGSVCTGSNTGVKHAAKTTGGGCNVKRLPVLAEDAKAARGGMGGRQIQTGVAALGSSLRNHECPRMECLQLHWYEVWF